MSTVTFEESGMQFGPFDSAHVFEVEKFTHEKCPLSKCVEFLLFKDSKAIFLEAKSSAPQGKDELNNDYLPSIVNKFSDSLHLVASDYMKVLSINDPLLAPLNGRKWGQISICLYVVIKGMPKEGLRDLQDKFNAYAPLKKLRKVWSPQRTDWIKVINDVKARDMGLIASGND